MHRPFLMIGMSFAITFIMFFGIWVIPDLMPLLVGFIMALFFIYIVLLWRDFKKQVTKLKSGLPSYYTGYSSNQDKDDDKKRDGIDNPSDRRDVSDD